MPLDPTLYLPVAVKAANALCKRNPYLDRDEAHGQALLELVLLAEAYDPSRDRHKNPTRYLTWAVKCRLIDRMRTLGPLSRHEYRRRVRAGNPVPNRVKLGPLTEPTLHDDPAQNLQAQDVIARAARPCPDGSCSTSPCRPRLELRAQAQSRREMLQQAQETARGGRW